jgi:protein ImuA
VVLDHAGEFYPPAAVRMGLELDQMILVQAAGPADHFWAMDQALRCPGVAAVLGWPQKLDGRTFRRLQLAAEQGRGLGLLVRPEPARHEPSWADVRLLVEPHPCATNAGRRLRIQVLRSRGQAGGGIIEVEIDDETCTVHLAARLDRPTISSRATGA